MSFCVYLGLDKKVFFAETQTTSRLSILTSQQLGQYSQLSTVENCKLNNKIRKFKIYDRQMVCITIKTVMKYSYICEHFFTTA